MGCAGTEACHSININDCDHRHTIKLTATSGGIALDDEASGALGWDDDDCAGRAILGGGGLACGNDDTDLA